jgi:NTE family protein
MQKMGLVLQGGGALGAYESGAVTRLVELGWQPVAVTGVSIGAINTAAIAGAIGGDIPASLRRLWKAITLTTNPFWPANQQGLFSMLGNPGFYQLRTDFLNMTRWTSLCDVSPMRKTLDALLDFKQINDWTHIRCSVTATNVATGTQVSFSNHLADPGVSHRVTPKVQKMQITPDHILASGSLPPGFPMTKIDGVHYWDGGLFDNTPIEALLDLLDHDEISKLPIFVINLFPTHGGIPHSLSEVQGRMMEIAYENRFWAAYEDPRAGLAPFTDMLEGLERDLPSNSPVRETESFRRLRRLRALKNLNVISAQHIGMAGGTDFSAYGVRRRFDIGYKAVDHYFAQKSTPRNTQPRAGLAKLSVA